MNYSGVVVLWLQRLTGKVATGSFICCSHLRDNQSVIMTKWVPYRKGRKCLMTSSTAGNSSFVTL